VPADPARAATSDEAKDLRREASALKEVVAELTLENRLLKKSGMGRTMHEISGLRKTGDHSARRAIHLPMRRTLMKLGIPERPSTAGTIFITPAGPKPWAIYRPGRIVSATGSPTWRESRSSSFTLTVDPFGSAHCDLVAELKPEVVSFHFGPPNPDLLARVKGVGAKILSSATCVKEAIWLEQRGCDAIIAQGLEAGGHRGMFLSDNVATQAGPWLSCPKWRMQFVYRSSLRAGSPTSAELPPRSCLALRACRWELPIFFVPKRMCLLSTGRR
jgi:Nitronate monooxygenase